jgi:NAD(P)-dependent dehydrogenase (short-subunit alcohol dehydrogenase family)
MDLELDGRVAVVTGASKGIGLAIVRTLLEEGAHVVAASRTPPDLDVDHVAVDLMDPDAPAAVIAHAARRYGGLDILVNNLGGPPPGDRLPHAGFLSRSDADWQGILEFNLLSAVRACRAALPLLLERGGGAIVNVASSVARQPAPMNLDYGAAKAGLLNLTKGLSEEFGAAGVRVNSVSPGPTLTPWWTDAGGAADIVAGWAGSDADSVLTTLAPAQMQLTTGRFVAPQEIADAVALRDAVALLASPRSGSTTGAEWVVDGGMLKAL